MTLFPPPMKCAASLCVRPESVAVGKLNIRRHFGFQMENIHTSLIPATVLYYTLYSSWDSSTVQYFLPCRPRGLPFGTSFITVVFRDINGHNVAGLEVITHESSGHTRRIQSRTREDH